MHIKGQTFLLRPFVNHGPRGSAELRGVVNSEDSALVALEVQEASES